MTAHPPEPPDASLAGPAGTPYAAGRVATLTAPTGIDGVEADWDSLALAAPQRLPMLGPTCLRADWRHQLDDGDVMRIHVAHSGPRLVGVLPVVERVGRLGAVLMSPPRARSGDLLLGPDAPTADLVGLVVAAFREAPHARSLTIAGVRDTSRTLRALDAAHLPFAVVVDEDERGSYVPIEGATLEGLRASMSANFRRNLRKAGNRLAREAGVAFRFEGGADASPASLDRFLALEAAGWKGRGGTAITQEGNTAAYYREISEGFAAKRQLEWHTLEIGGAPVAMHFGVRFGRALVLLKIAYDERFARLGPGNLLFERLLEREFEARTAIEVNCTTDMAWHRNWALPRSRYARVTFVPRGLVPGLLGWLPTALNARAKRTAWLRRLLGKPPLDDEAAPAPEARARRRTSSA